MSLASWLRNWQRSLERRWALHQTLQRQSVARRRAVRPHLEMLEDRRLLSTYTVTSMADDGSTGTLRDAINQANMAGSTITEIDFNIGTSGSAQTIDLTSQLPALAATGVFINGLSQGGSNNTTQLITLNGTNAGSDSDGLILQGLNNAISGLILSDFTNNGIEIEGNNNTIGETASGAGNVISGNSNDGVLIDNGIFGTRVQGNYIGTDSTGSKAVANGNGIEVDGPGNTIGGTSAGAGNIISGNSKDGILIDSNVTGVPIQGNYIGTDVTGTLAVGNNVGIEDAASNITIGGTAAGASNLISGNTSDGVLIDSSASGVQVQGNFIGTNADGSGKFANNDTNGYGIEVAGVNCTVGGTATGARNIISGNSEDGVLLDGSASGIEVQGNYIGTDVTGSNTIGNNSSGIEIAGFSNTLGGTSAAARNTIVGVTKNGILIDGTSSNIAIQGNYIGTDSTGTKALMNANGIVVNGSNITIGGTVTGAGNLISGSIFFGFEPGGNGIAIQQSASGVQVQGNYIGTDVTGSKAPANGTGISINGTNVTVGGTSTAARNIISGNTTGVGVNSLAGSGVLVEGNYIDTNTSSGVVIAVPCTIGGTASGAGNLISGNGEGVVILYTSGVQVQGNYIGTDPTGTIAFPNSIGVEVDGPNDTIGGTVAGAGNLISGNSGDGVLIDASSSGHTVSGVQVQGNYIGTDVTGTKSLGNGNGVEVDASNNSIGGSVASAGNIIANNSQGGVLVNTGTGNTIRLNSIFANGSANTGPGITLTNGGNNSLAAPTLTSATINGNTLTVKGTFNSPSANNTYLLDFYANLSGDGEGKVYLGSLTVTSTNTTLQSFTFTTTTTVTGTYPLVTATLTHDDSGDTSPFSSGVTVSPTPVITQNPTDQTATAGDNVSFTASAVGGPTPTVQWQLSTDGGKTFSNISGATSTTLTLNNVTTSMSGNEYQAVFTNSSGSATTSAATLTVNSPPVITGNPASQTVTAGQSATFTASAGGNPTPTVQWQVSTDGGKRFTNISGAANTTLTLNNVATSMNGNQYEAVFTSSAGSVTSTAATLTVNAAPSAPVITENPASQTVTAGDDVSFSASASGDPTPTVQWQVSTDGGKTFTNISGATSTTLTRNNVTTSMNGDEYRTVFTNSVGSATSTAAVLTVHAATAKPVITENPSNQTATAGANVSFTESANGNPTPAVQWQVSTDGGKTFSNISGATSITLTLNNVTTAMNGNEYEAVFTNSAGSATSTAATLTVHAPPSPPPAPPPAPAASPPAPPTLNTPPLLAFLNSLLGGGTETLNADGTITLTDSFFGIPLIVSTFNPSGTLVSVNLLGIDITFLSE